MPIMRQTHPKLNRRGIFTTLYAGLVWGVISWAPQAQAVAAIGDYWTLGPINTELTSFNLNGEGALPLGFSGNPNDANNGYQFVNSSIQIKESATQASTGQAYLTSYTSGGAPQNNDTIFVNSFFDVFFDITVTDIDPVNNFIGNMSSFNVSALGPAHMQLGGGEVPATCIADTSQPNYGCLPPVGDAYIGHFNVVIPAGVDINGNGEPDIIKFTLATHNVGDVSETWIENLQAFDTFNTTMNLDGGVMDQISDPPFSITLTGPTTGRQQILVPAVPEPGVFGMLGLGLVLMRLGRSRWLQR